MLVATTAVGEVVLAGSVQELVENPLIQRAYLGGA